MLATIWVIPRLTVTLNKPGVDWLNHFLKFLSQHICRRPRLLAPRILPWRIQMGSWYLSSWRMMWPRYCNLRRFTVASTSFALPMRLRISSFVTRCVQDTRNIRRYSHISIASPTSPLSPPSESKPLLRNRGQKTHSIGGFVFSNPWVTHGSSG